MILSPDQLRLLTGKTRAPAQIKELRAMGVPYLTRSDGKPVVLADDVVASKATPKRTPRLRL